MKKKQAFQRKMEAAALKLQAQFRGRSGRRQAWARKHITGRAAHKSYLSSHSISVPDATMSLDGLLLLKRFIQVAARIQSPIQFTSVHKSFVALHIALRDTLCCKLIEVVPHYGDERLLRTLFLQNLKARLS